MMLESVPGFMPRKIDASRSVLNDWPNIWTCLGLPPRHIFLDPVPSPTVSSVFRYMAEYMVDRVTPTAAAASLALAYVTPLIEIGISSLAMLFRFPLSLSLVLAGFCSPLP